MKKIKILLILTILFTFPIISVHAEDCEDYDRWNCKNTDSKGNLCEMDSSGYCYTSPFINNKTCFQRKTKSSCNNLLKCHWEKEGGIAGLFTGFCVANNTTEKGKCTDYNAASCPTSDMDGYICERDKSSCFKSPSNSNSNYITCNSITNKDQCEKAEKCAMGKNGCYSTENKISITSTDGKFRCSDVRHLTGAWLLIRILAPFLIVLFGSLDLFKTITSGDEKETKKLKSNLIKRIIAFVLLITLPFIIQLIFSLMGTYGSDNVCLLKCIATNDTSDKGCDE